VITKKVNRYYCEFCKKSGGAAGHMKKHEEHCTLNPKRFCGYCHMSEEEQPNIADLLAILPNPKEYEHQDAEYDCFYYRGLEEAVDAVLPKLREACNNCPACIVAALRQKGIPVPLVSSFNFKAECQSVWNDFNTAHADNYGY